jgi:thiol-disulfide isomerase/thioredoxin
MSFLSLNTVGRSIGAILVGLCFACVAAGQVKPSAIAAATDVRAVAVTQVDLDGLKKALTPKGKPLLVNFWATWCDPCREEFPDLVKLDAEYKGKIDFITISLDEVEELNRDVPKFLLAMKAEMPAFLLKSNDDDAAISLVSKNFGGALPFTILYDSGGKEAYFRQGKVRIETVKLEIDKLLTPAK